MIIPIFQILGQPTTIRPIILLPLAFLFSHSMWRCYNAIPAFCLQFVMQPKTFEACLIYYLDLALRELVIKIVTQYI